MIYTLKSDSVRPYVERIWGWDEDYQLHEFDSDFSAIEQFFVIEVDGRFAGFVQSYFDAPYYEVVEIHLLPEYRGNGIGSDFLKSLQKVCLDKNRMIRIGCFKENYRAKNLYIKLGFVLATETDTDFILEYSRKPSVTDMIASAESRKISATTTSSSDAEQAIEIDYPQFIQKLPRDHVR